MCEVSICRKLVFHTLKDDDEDDDDDDNGDDNDDDNNDRGGGEEESENREILLYILQRIQFKAVRLLIESPLLLSY